MVRYELRLEIALAMLRTIPVLLAFSASIPVLFAACSGSSITAPAAVDSAQIAALAAAPGAPTHLSYATNPLISNVARTIAPDVPTFDGAPVTFTSDPPLPPGVLLDPS